MGTNKFSSESLVDQSRGWDENTQTWTYKRVAKPAETKRDDDCDDIATAAVSGLIIHELLDGD